MKTKHLKSFKMRLGYFLPVIIFLLVSSCSKKEHNERIIYNREYKQQILDGLEKLKMFMITSSSPGMSVSVSIDGKTVWSQGLGTANKELHVPVTPATKFRIGRTSSMFTAFLIAKLQEEGKLHTDSSLYSYIPEYPKKQWDFTLKQLGTYSSGLSEENLSDLLMKGELKNLKEYITKYQDTPLTYEPNTYFSPSDYSTCLLGIVAESITKKSYPKLVKEMILDTLGLDETLIDSPYFITENRSAPYYQNYIAQLTNSPSLDFRFCEPAVGYLSTADDLNKIGQSILFSDFFSNESKELFFTKNRLLQGLETKRSFGWWIFTDNFDREIYAQIGSTIGGSSILLIYPQQKLVLSACLNLEDENINIPALQVAEIFLSKIDPRSKQEAETKEDKKGSKDNNKE